MFTAIQIRQIKGFPKIKELIRDMNLYLDNITVRYCGKDISDSGNTEIDLFIDE